MRSKRFKGNKRGRYLALLIFAAITVTCFVYPHFYAVLFKKEFNLDNLIRISGLNREREAQTAAAVISNKLVILKDKTLTLRGAKGDILWEKSMDLQEPIIIALKDIIAVADISKGVLYGLNDKGEELWQVTAPGGIGRIGADRGHIWIIENQRGVATAIDIYDQGGKEVSCVQIDNAQVTGVTVSRGGSFVAVSTASVEDGDIIGRIIVYKDDGAMLWAKSYRDVLIMDLKFIAGDALNVLTERALIGYNADGEMRWQEEIRGYIAKALLMDEGIVALNTREDYRSGVPIDKSGETLLYDKEGILLKKIPHSEGITGLVEGQDCIGIYSDRCIKFVTLDGKKVWDKTFKSDLLAVYLLEDNYAAYILGGKLHFEPVTQ